MDFINELNSAVSLADEYIKSVLPKEKLPQEEIVKAMDYSLSSGGKRIRPVIAIFAAKSLGAGSESVMPYAAAIELIHTYSLIHDDLPCMDNDDLRRGRPTNHKVFGEATAVLAGDALLNFAFETALMADTEPEKKIALLKIIARSAGLYGMIGGQILDMEGEKRKLAADEIRLMQNLKTGALIKAAAAIGAVTAGERKEFFDVYAENLGLAFQLKDDILDVTATTEELGKPVLSDEKNEKSTFVSLYGVDGTKRLLEETTEKAIASLPEGAELLKELALYLLERKK
jgi:geranylgeranyl diphosphate synthase type II